jgi:peptidoglycan LD-endopeptidase CwlK
MPSRKLEDLHPDIKLKAELLVLEAKKNGINVLVYCTFRSLVEQDAEYAKGRTKPGKKVTYLRGGQSKHNFMIENKPASKAFDCVPWNPKTRECFWNDKTKFQLLGQIGEKIGLIWGGRWKMRDFPHFEIE